MPKALKITEETVDYAVTYARELGFDLTYLPYSMEDAADYGYDLYLITDGTSEKRNITFTTFGSDDFFRNWKFTTAENHSDFAEIEKA